ncbi:hypothetical protein EK904_012027 [Melospiza melodia maxima]|nr:hypothetical protein EK904_012027 [Melospiza melodia maxima]
MEITSALLTADYIQEQELQVFSSTRGKALKRSGKGMEVALVLVSQLLPGEVGIPCHPALRSIKPLPSCHRSGTPGFEPPSQILLSDAWHRPMGHGEMKGLHQGQGYSGLTESFRSIDLRKRFIDIVLVKEAEGHTCAGLLYEYFTACAERNRRGCLPHPTRASESAFRGAAVL